MKRRTRLRKQGLPPDPPRAARPLPASLFDLSKALTEKLSTESRLSPARIHAYATDWEVLEDVRRHGVQRVANSLARYGMTPTELYGRFA